MALINKALITGVTGQDGSYLAELLLAKGYQVHGMNRVTSVNNCERIKHLLDNPNFILHYGDLSDGPSINTLMEKIQPDEVYNLGAQSHVRKSFDVPEQTAEANAIGVLRLLEAIRKHAPNARFYQASTSELFGKVHEVPQKETTPFYPRSPYGIAKLAAYWYVVNYRESYNLHASNGILFNHESPRRGEDFVTLKVIRGLINVYKRTQDHLELGNLDAKRDWGYAGDYVEAMWIMLQKDTPGDYVVATGETHSVRELVEETCKLLNIEIAWNKGIEATDEIGYDVKTGQTIIKINPVFYRPSEVDLLVGDPTKAKTELGWTAKTTFKDLIKLMVEAELKI